MAKDAPATEAENTNEIQKLQAENQALRAVLDEHKTKLAGYADIDAKLAAYETANKGYAEYLASHVKAKYEAAPEWVRAKLKVDEIAKMDPLQGITAIDQMSDFFNDIKENILKEYEIKDPKNDPTRRPQTQGNEAPAFRSSIDIVRYLTNMNNKKE